MKALMQELRENAVKSITGADSIEALEALRVKYLGKKGQGMVEYALIIAFVVGIAAVAFGGESGLGKAIKDTFTKATTTLNTLAGNGTT